MQSNASPAVHSFALSYGYYVTKLTQGGRSGPWKSHHNVLLPKSRANPSEADTGPLATITQQHKGQTGATFVFRYVWPLLQFCPCSILQAKSIQPKFQWVQVPQVTLQFFPELPQNIPSDIGCVLQLDLAAKNRSIFLGVVPRRTRSGGSNPMIAYRMQPPPNCRW